MQGFGEVFHPLLISISMFPIISLGFSDLTTMKLTGSFKRIAACIFVSGSLTALPTIIYFSTPRFMDGITWDGAEIGDSGEAFMRVEGSLMIWSNSKHINIDLNTLTESQMKWILRQVEVRLSLLIGNFYGMRQCGLAFRRHRLRAIVNVLDNFRSQYIRLKKYELCKRMFVLNMIPIGISICTKIIYSE